MKRFEIRGIKGLYWQGFDNYRDALPWLAEHDLNFLMFCYTSFPGSGKEWMRDYSEEDYRQFREMAQDAKKGGVELCLAINPALYRNPPLVYSSDEHYNALLSKLRRAHETGINWFALCLDDISKDLEPADQQKFGSLAPAQIAFVNRLWNDLRSLSPRPHLIFCPSVYLTEQARQHLDYVKAMGEGIDKDVMMFWTGPQCCSYSINADDARLFGQWIKRKPFVWDNFPVNDGLGFRLVMSPLKNRSADLPEATCGYIANPMLQWQASKIPLETTAAYLNDPAGYDPQKAMQRLLSSYPVKSRRAIELLVDVYGSAFWGEPGFPPLPSLDSKSAKLALYKLLTIRKELGSDNGQAVLWNEIRDGIEADIRFVEIKAYPDRRIDISPLKAHGDDFRGGGGELYGYSLYSRVVDYVYAVPTGRDVMSVDFKLDSVPDAGVDLRLVALDDDGPAKCKIRIALNSHTIFEGENPYISDYFTVKSFAIPASALKQGINVLEIRNIETDGALSAPPWFMVSEAELVVR